MVSSAEPCGVLKGLIQFIVADSVRLSAFNRKTRMFQHAVKQRTAASSQAMAVYVQTRAKQSQSLTFVTKLAGSATLQILTATSPAMQTVTRLSLLTRQPDMC
jgi:hypothetical protein